MAAAGGWPPIFGRSREGPDLSYLTILPGKLGSMNPTAPPATWPLACTNSRIFAVAYPLLNHRAMARVLVMMVLAGCASSPEFEPLAEAESETGVAGPFVPTPAGKFDLDGERGPRIRDGAATEVWAAVNAWQDTDTDAARRAGLAWGADSGLDWEAKFDAWVASFEPTERATGYGQTFAISTPFGDRVLDAPTLECAEVAVMLRVAFSSWHGLPFFIQGWDAHTRQTMYAGHFGFVNSNGNNVSRFPSFRNRYPDHSDWQPGDAWPTDRKLRGYRLGTDDGIAFLSEDGEEVGAGAYFDEFFLNKRVGYFTRLILLYFGSANLADEVNMFHIAPEATTAGDVLLERWQRRGIGHTIPVIRAQEPVPGRLELWVASGSMPRRQPVWEDPASARHSFTLANTGGEGTASDGTPYAALGGGIRRWRTATREDGRWRNLVRQADQNVYIDPGDTAAIAARPEAFETILADVGPEEQIEVALVQIAAAREHLRRYPASCAARTRREDAFERMYALTEEVNGWDRARTDTEHRVLEDFVLGELEYEASKTCCWNRSTSAMFEIIMEYARTEQADAEATGMCIAPTVFRAEADGYDRWANFAADLDRGGEWVGWTADETCPWADVPQDSFSQREVADFCGAEVVDPVEPDPIEPPPADPPDACDALGQDDSREAALPLTTAVDGEICTGDEDWYFVEAGAVSVTFEHANGDLDLESVDVEGRRVGSSTSVDNEERLSHTGPFYVRVYGYSGAANTYSIAID